MKSGYDDIMEKAVVQYSAAVFHHCECYCVSSRQQLGIKGVVNLSAWNQHEKYMCSIRNFCIGAGGGWLLLASSILGARKASPATGSGSLSCI